MQGSLGDMHDTRDISPAYDVADDFRLEGHVRGGRVAQRQTAIAGPGAGVIAPGGGIPAEDVMRCQVLARHDDQQVGGDGDGRSPDGQRGCRERVRRIGQGKVFDVADEVEGRVWSPVTGQADEQSHPSQQAA